KYYGGTLKIVRDGLRQQAKVQRVRLVYEGGKLLPSDPAILNDAVTRTQRRIEGVEVLFQ
ncbi:hypothetical protein, partial [Corallococcus sp. 4LFB]